MPQCEGNQNSTNDERCQGNCDDCAEFVCHIYAFFVFSGRKNMTHQRTVYSLMLFFGIEDDCVILVIDISMKLLQNISANNGLKGIINIASLCNIFIYNGQI